MSGCVAEPEKHQPMRRCGSQEIAPGGLVQPVPICVRLITAPCRDWPGPGVMDAMSVDRRCPPQDWGNHELGNEGERPVSVVI